MIYNVHKWNDCFKTAEKKNLTRFAIIISVEHDMLSLEYVVINILSDIINRT